jgi:hypothetical protein
MFFLVISFDPQPSHDRDDICSPSNDIEPSNEIFSGVTPDLDIIYETKSIVSSNDVCTESLCVPYTDEQDGKKSKYSFNFLVILFYRNFNIKRNINNNNYNRIF